MASRFYFESTVAQTTGVNAIASNWTDDIRASLGIAGRSFKLIPSGTVPASTAYSQPQGQPAVAPPPDKYTMHAIFEYAIPSGLVIAGNMRGELAGFRNNNANNISLALAVTIRNAGVTKATLIRYFPAASNFFGFFPGHVADFPSTAITDTGYITAAGDVLYVEIGLGWAVSASTCGVTYGYNNANGDWAVGAGGTADSNPTTHNPWIEFETTLTAAPAHDAFLLTVSGPLGSRPSAPTTRGLHFVNIETATRTEYFWDGTAWQKLYLESLATAADRTKLLTLTDAALGAGNTGPQLMPSAVWGGTGLGLFAPSGLVGLVIGPNGTMGRGAYSDVNLMRHDAVTITSSTRLVGWNLVGLNANGTGGISGISCTVNDAPSANSTNEILGSEWLPRANNINANGPITGVRVQQGGYSGNSATRGAVKLFQAKAASSYLNQTVPSLAYYTIDQVPAAVGTISGSQVGFKQELVFNIGATRRGGQFINSVEIIGNPSGGAAVGRFQVNVFDRGYIYKDNQGTAHFWEMKGLADGTPIIIDLGTTQPTT